MCLWQNRDGALPLRPTFQHVTIATPMANKLVFIESIIITIIVIEIVIIIIIITIPMFPIEFVLNLALDQSCNR